MTSHNIRWFGVRVCFNQTWIGRCTLNRVKDRNAIRSAYNRTDYLERRRKMMVWWSRYIDEAAIGSLSVTGTVHLRAVS